jgi:hypothetical protein
VEDLEQVAQVRGGIVVRAGGGVGETVNLLMVWEQQVICRIDRRLINIRACIRRGIDYACAEDGCLPHRVYLT